MITYLFFQNQKLQQQVLNPQISPTIQAPSPTSKTVSSISISTDETANWKTYENINAGIFFKFPAQFAEQAPTEAIVSGPNIVAQNTNLVSTIADITTVLKNTDAPFDGFTIYEVEPAKIIMSFDEYITKEVDGVKNSPRGIPNATSKILLLVLIDSPISILNLIFEDILSYLLIIKELLFSLE